MVKGSNDSKRKLKENYKKIYNFYYKYFRIVVIIEQFFNYSFYL